MSRAYFTTFTCDTCGISRTVADADDGPREWVTRETVVGGEYCSELCFRTALGEWSQKQVERFYPTKAEVTA
jgi:uncharacterized protein (DUF983 family)